MSELHAHHAALVDRLETDDAIRAAFAAHPRHHFIPDTVWPEPTGLPLFRTAEPGRWARLVYSGDAITTQANDGGSGPRNEPSSSSSAPQVMADMIAAAGIGKGSRVLEVGTGTGWNAAILATLVGDEGTVTSIEVDPGVADKARQRLAGSGVEVHTASEPPAGRIYDAVIATCAVTRIPPAWLDVCVESGLIVLPWSPHPASQSTPVAALQKSTAASVGAFVREGAFMRDRSQRPGDLPFPGLGQAPTHTAHFPISSTELITSGVLTQLMLMLPGMRLGTGVRPFQGQHGRIVCMGTSAAWAYIWPDGTVTSAGQDRLGESAARAYRLLEKTGFPSLDAFTLSVRPDCASYRVEYSSAGQAWHHRVAP